MPINRYNAEGLETAVLDELENLVTNPVVLARMVANLARTEEDAKARERLDEVRKAMDAIHKQVHNLVAAVAEGTVFASLWGRLGDLEQQEQELKVQTVTPESALSREHSELTMDDAYRWFRDIRELLAAGSAEAQKAVMRVFVR